MEFNRSICSSKKRELQLWIRLLRAMSSPDSDVCMEVDPTASLGSCSTVDHPHRE